MKIRIFLLSLLFCGSAFGGVLNKTIVTAASMASSVTSSPVFLEDATHLSIQAVFTGSPVGTFKIQTSDDRGKQEDGTLITNWSDYTGSSKDISAAGDWTWRMRGLGDRWVRLVYTVDSGTGSLTVKANSKGSSTK